MIRYLLDTCTCIEVIRRRPPAALRRLVGQPTEEVGISSITLAELHFGAARSSDPPRNQLAIAQFRVPLTLAPFDDQAALAYGELRSTLEAAGTPIGPLDTLIAAHALALDATLITNNTREFKRVPKLRVKDWTH